MPVGMIFFLAPVIGWSWPALAPILTAAAAAMGYKKLTEGGSNRWLRGKLTKKLENLRRETVALDSVLTEVIAEDLGTEERMAFQRDDILLIFRKDTRGKFFIDVSGPRKLTGNNLRIRGEEFARELVKKFAYHKMVEQIERRGATIVEEEIRDNGDIVLQTRQWH